MEVRDRYAGSVVAPMEVDPAQIHLYGCAAVEPAGEEGAGCLRTVVRPAGARQDLGPAFTGRLKEFVADPEDSGDSRDGGADTRDGRRAA